MVENFIEMTRDRFLETDWKPSITSNRQVLGKCLGERKQKEMGPTFPRLYEKGSWRTLIHTRALY